MRGFGLLILLSLTTLFFSITFFSIFQLNRSVNVQNGNGLNHYQYFQKDILTNKSFFGTVSLPIDIEEGSFISRIDTHYHKNILISRFGSYEYECIGSCYCDEDSTERRISKSSNHFLKGITYLVAAASSTIAYNLASKFYEKECNENLLTICPNPGISMVECKKVPEKPPKEIEGEKGIFMCKGNCVEKKATSLGTGYPPTKISGKVSCKNLRLEEEIVIYRNRDLSQSDSSNIDKRMLMKAKERFLKKNLALFCEKSSWVVYHYVYDAPHYIEKGRYLKEKMVVSVCTHASKKTKLKDIACRRKKEK